VVNVVQFKDANVCILLKETGFGGSFNKEFSKVTAEGYELKAIHEHGQFTVAGFGGGTQYAFYFQKSTNSKNVQATKITNTPSDEPVNPFVAFTEHKENQKDTMWQNICKSCNQLNNFEATLCTKCGKVL